MSNVLIVGAGGVGQVVAHKCAQLPEVFSDITLASLSPLVESRARLRDLALLGLIGGAPTIAGTWTGAFTYSDPLSLLFLGIGAGAIFQVVGILVRGRASQGEPVLEALAKPRNVAGLLLGFLLMYATSLLVAG